MTPQQVAPQPQPPEQRAALQEAPKKTTKKAAPKKTTEVQPITMDTERYNKFIYRLRLCDDAIKQQWGELKRSGTDTEKNYFMEQVMLVKKGVPPASLKKRTVLSHVETSGEEGSWMSWHKAKEQEGEAKLLEMIRCGSVKSKKDPRLPPDSQIGWPQHLLIALAESTWSSKRAKRDEDELEEGSNSDPECATAAVDAFKDKSQHYGAAAQSSQPVTKQEPTPAPLRGDDDGGAHVATEAEKTCIACVRKAHSAWDRAARDHKSVCDRSKINDNTKGSKIESELEALQEIGKEIDATLQRYENKFLMGEPLTGDDISDAATQCHRMTDLLKKGSKLSSALKSWFRLQA